jgi:FkbM family methyltransferase
VSGVAGLRLVNALHRRMSPALRRRFFHLTCNENWRVAGDWLVDFAGRNLVLPLRRGFPLAWMAAVGFHGYDPELHDIYTRLVRSASPPRVFFDVGANYGLHSLRLLAHGARVISFEPNPECHAFFVECCRANGVSPDIVAAAVGARAGWATLTVPVGRSYLGSIVPGVQAQWGREVVSFRVPLTSLDGFAAERGVVPDLVKIDVDGGELDVLHGARGLLASARPVVIFESWPSAAERRDMFDVLTAHGYRIHDVVVGGRRAALTCEQFLASPATNFVARPALVGMPAEDVTEALAAGR